MESKRSRKGRKQRNATHHPWDEVSLPGAGTGPSEQPTILVINQVNGETTREEIKLNADNSNSNSSSSSKAAHEAASAQTDNDQTDSAPAEEPLKPEILIKPPTPPTPPHVDDNNVLHIESHLIEDVHIGATPAGSIGINELPPIDDELTLGTSKVETDTNVRTIIEVEPAGVKTKQAIATPVTAKQQSAAVEHQHQQQQQQQHHHQHILNNDEHEATTKTGNVAAKAQPAKTETDAVVTTADEPKGKTATEAKVAGEAESDAALIRSTAEHLVDEIERRVIDTLSRQAQDVAGEDCAVQCLAEVKTEQEGTLSDKVDAQLTELTSILKSKPQVELNLPEETAAGEAAVTVACNELKIVEVPTPKTALEEEQRKLFIDSLPQIEPTNTAETDAKRLSADCKREYYQSLKKYLLDSHQDKPPVPLQTYRWEDLKRAKERGGYPWTHLYKRPLGPDEEPEIVLLLRKSQELRFKSESPKSQKKVRYDEQVLVKETERYIQDLTDDEDVDVTEDDDEEADEHVHDPELAQHKDTENPSLHSESISCVSDSVLAVGHSKPRRTFRLTHIRNIIKRRRSGRTQEDAQSLPGNSANASRQSSIHDLAPPPGPLIPQIVKTPSQKKPHCFPMMKKLKSFSERQKKRLNIKRIALKKDEKIVLGDEPKILRLKSSPKCDRGEIPHFIEKQDSDDILEIVEYDESPSRKRNKAARDDDEQPTTSAGSGIVQPDEVIELTAGSTENKEEEEEAAEAAAVTEDLSASESQQTEDAAPPKKAPRLRREHVYEEIGPGQVLPTASEPLTDILPMSNVDALKKSLMRQDNVALQDVEAANQPIPLDRMGSSEEEQVAAAAAINAAAEGQKANSLLAPISSIDSTSSDEDRARLAQLASVAEESDAASAGEAAAPAAAAAVLDVDGNGNEQLELKPSIKKEPSPAPSDKKVTFSHVEDEAEPHREDIELPEDVREAAAEAAGAKDKWRHLSDHEYEPIGVPPKTTLSKEASPAPATATLTAQSKNGASRLSADLEKLRREMETEAIGAQSTELDDRDISSAGTTPRTESRTDYEMHTSQVDSSALEELPLKRENRKKGFMASAQDRTRRMQDGLRNQAGKIRTKLRTQPKKTSPAGSPKAKERRRFRAPEFSKLKMPEIRKPDMSKFREMKRPEFTKFNKPDMSKFKLPEKFPTLKLRRSKSFKENETGMAADDETSSPVSAETPKTAEPTSGPRKMFEFNFGTYPRAFRKKKQTPLEPVESSLNTEGPSIIPSTETQPSMESSSSPQGDRGPGPVRSRWADKFSDVSYNDSEGSRYRRYGSELESFERESSLERRMKDDLEDTADTGSEAHDVGILGGVADSKQFAEFDEENRAIHEISNLRSHEFKRRPMVHQDSDLRSEDSKDAEGWTEKEIQKNKLLRKAELDAEASYYKYHAEAGNSHGDGQSTASSGKKVVMEEIDDDEFFLRKRGISEDNIQLRQYISEAIREGYEMPNALANVGQSSQDMEEDYDVPPPKPRRLHKSYRPEYTDSQEFQRSDYGDDLSMSQNGSDFLPAGAPKRPLRKGRGHSKYSVDSQDIPMADEGSNVQYFDDDEEYLRPPTRGKEQLDGLNNLDFALSKPKSYVGERFEEDEEVPRPQPPRRQKKRGTRDGASAEKDAFINGFGGRSVSNTFLQPQEDVIVYRTEHEYLVPLATPENYTDKSRSGSRFDEDDRTSHGADSLAMDVQVKPLAYEHHHGKDEDENEDDREIVEDILEEKYIIDMLENDGYAVVRKEQLPKPTPPARRKKFTRSPGERFATLPMRTKHGSPAPERPPPPQGYTPSEDFSLSTHHRRSATSLDAKPNSYLDDDYEEPEALERPESPRDLQSGEVINKMKFRPLPPPPRPPREKRSAKGERRFETDDLSPYRYEDSERIATSSTADSYDQNPDFEVEVSTQTDPLPDDFVCEEFEITEDMKVIEPRRAGVKTLEDLLKASATSDEVDSAPQLTEDEQLARGLQRFRDANQRSLSERSRASSQADRSKSASRPQTPSAVVIERRVSTPALSAEDEATLAAALIVRPIRDADLEDDELRREEEALRREGLLSDSSVQSKSDIETAGEEDNMEEGHLALSDYALSSTDLDAAVDKLEQTAVHEVYKFKLYDDEEVERTMKDREYLEDEDDADEKYSDHYDEDEEEEEEGPEDDDDWTAQKLRALELQEALEKELQEELAKQLQRESRSRTPEQPKLSSIEEMSTSPEIFSEEEQKLIATITAQKYKLEPEADRKQADKEESQIEPEDEMPEEAPIIEAVVEQLESVTESEPVQPPQPPPRRKSTTLIESPVGASVAEDSTSLTIAEEDTQAVAHIESVVTAQPQTSQLPSRLGELEVERLRVHALQAGQIMVSQLHGHEISAEEFACKSGNLVVQNIELPPGFIEGIVERVRSTEPTRATLLSTETQTSRQPSSSPQPEPPSKPPRQTKTTETATAAASQQHNLDEGTQTDASVLPLPPPPPVYPSVEYLQSLAPLAFYNLQRSAEAEAQHGTLERKTPHKCRRRHVQRSKRSAAEEGDEEQDELEHATDSEEEAELVERPLSRRSRTRSGTHPPRSPSIGDEPKTVAKAGRQFIAACSLELVSIINQLTHYVRGNSGALEPAQAAELQQRNIPALMVLFIVITFGLLIFLLNGRNVHTHHWDYFNPPSNEGRHT